MSVNDESNYPFLCNLKALIRNVVTSHIPYLGICLGGQLLAAALGAKVVSHRWEELGTLNAALTEEGKIDLLFKGIPELFSTFQWHHDSFDIPSGGVLLASSAACPHQSFRVGDSAWGLQFHPEVTREIVRGWSSWDSATSIRTDELLTSFEAEAVQYRRTARQIMNNFVTVAKLTHTAEQY